MNGYIKFLAHAPQGRVAFVVVVEGVVVEGIVVMVGFEVVFVCLEVVFGSSEREKKIYMIYVTIHVQQIPTSSYEGIHK